MKIAFRGRFIRFVLGLLLLCVFCNIGSGIALAADAAMNVDSVLDKARTQIDKVQKQLEKPPDEPMTDADLVQLRASALEAQTQAEAAAANIEPQVTSMKARVAELGTPVPDTPEAPDVADQRAQLTKSSSKLDAQLKLARLISVEAGQGAEQILKLRRSQFQAHLGERISSILSSSFWEELNLEWPKDARRLEPLLKELSETITATSNWVWLFVVLVSIAVLGLWVRAGRLLMRWTTTRVAPGRLRRSVYAAALVLLACIAPGFIAAAVRLGFSWSSPLSENMEVLLDGLVGIVCFGGLVAGLGHALLTPDRPTWRLSPMLDNVASGLRWFPLLLAVMISGGWAVSRLATIVNASLAATVALDYITSLALGITMGLGMSRANRLRREYVLDPDKSAPVDYPLWMTILIGLTWLALVSSVVFLLVGYVALGSFVVKQVVWVALVLGSAYLLAVLIDDGCSSLLNSVKRNEDESASSYTWTRVRSQAIVLLSGLGRLLVVLVALMLLLAPFGEGPTEWLHRMETVYSGIPIGEVKIRPTAVLLSLLIFFLGFGAVKTLKHWLADQYLPTTSLDPGMRLSAATLFGYAGYVLAVALALSAVGIGLERVAWIASALSVGIGFGLQAVVQNFVSGLILLAERPVKVGDWVTLGGVEGDIRRINVRATEIQMGDRSTVIVPNSEFITKIVRNVTHANPLGRVQIKLAMPVTTDADKARDLILSTFHDNLDVLDAPAPEVLLDGIDINGMLFNATGYVGSPRVTSGVRSALLFDVLKRLREAGLPLSTPTTMLLKDAGETILPSTAAAAPTGIAEPVATTESRGNPQPA